jgi:predicted nucleic acid-binding Zn ribbon protein
MSRRRPKVDPVPVGKAVSQVLTELGHGGAAAVLRLTTRWEEIVGAEVAAHAWPSDLRGGVLEVTAASSVWAQHLQLRREEILAELAAALGEHAPTGLRFRVG